MQIKRIFSPFLVNSIRHTSIETFDLKASGIFVGCFEWSHIGLVRVGFWILPVALNTSFRYTSAQLTHHGHLWRQTMRTHTQTAWTTNEKQNYVWIYGALFILILLLLLLCVLYRHSWFGSSIVFFSVASCLHHKCHIWGPNIFHATLHSIGFQHVASTASGCVCAYFSSVSSLHKNVIDLNW